MSRPARPPILTVIGKSNSGKTTLVVKLVRALTARGVRVGTVKHHGHDFDIDRPGKDSYRHKDAGAVASVVASPRRLALVRDVERDVPLDEIARDLLAHVDLVLGEGYKSALWPKIEVHRAALGRPLLSSPETGLVAVATDEPLDTPAPQYDLNDAEGLADLIVERFLT